MPCNIVSVEKDEIWRGLIERAVREVLGCDTHFGVTAEEGANAVIAWRPSGIITALKYPIAAGKSDEALGGLQFIQIIRVDAVVVRIPTIILSGDDPRRFGEQVPPGVLYFDKGTSTAFDAVRKLASLIGMR